MPLVDSLTIVLPRIKNARKSLEGSLCSRGLMADIYDGQVWEKFMSFADERDCSVCLSLTLNVDWLEPYKYYCLLAVLPACGPVCKSHRDLHLHSQTHVSVKILTYKLIL